VTGARLATLAAAVAAALVLAGGALATPSGKPTHHHPGAKAPPAKPAPKRVSGAECPRSLRCDFVPAGYAQNSSDPGDYGNYDLADRPADGLAIRYVVIHDTEVAYDPTIAEFQNPVAYVSAHYVIRSSDGHVTQMVPTEDVAWHAGNWWVNMHSVGIENEGFATELAKWFTPRLYSSLAKLTRYQAERYGIPLDREHIIGHDQVPGPVAANQPGMHWDPGPYFDWARFMRLLGAPITGARGDRSGRIVTIDPNFKTNRPVVTYCDTSPCRTLPSQPTNFVYLHTAPSESSPLVSDPLLSGTNLEPNGVGTTQANDWGDKAVTGQSFVVAGRSGDWTAIWYGGQKAWFENSHGHDTVAGRGLMVTPKAGSGSIPVYGRAYPSSVSTATLGYTIPEGQAYVAKDLVGADYYSASTFNAPETYRVVTGPERFYEISFNHRIAFVKASDVEVLR
jgi:N-acetylmuramoyl-L-alanine amidase